MHRLKEGKINLLVKRTIRRYELLYKRILHALNNFFPQSFSGEHIV